MSRQICINNVEAFADRFSVSRETCAKLETYERILRDWQKKINLVAPATLAHVWHRHFADSAQLLEHVPRALLAGSMRWVDLGSGAGFPGLVIAILLSGQGGARVTLVESDQRKAAFLREVARQTGTPVEILSIRIESAATQFKLPFQVVSARALASLDNLLLLTRPFWSAETVGIFPKGRDFERELDEARRRWSFEYELRPSATEESARIVIVRKVEPKPEGVKS